MGLRFFRKPLKGGAGFSCNDNSIFYIEALRQGEGYGLGSSCRISSPSPILEQGMLRNVALLRPLMENLVQKRQNQFPLGINVGLPPRNVMMRVVTVPEMTLEDARGALQWDFEKHFPFPAAEAVYDVVDITAHAKASSGEMKLLVAAVRSRLVEDMMDLFTAFDMEVSSVEPSLIGAFRATLGPVPGLSGGYLLLLLEDSSTQLILGSGDAALLFRTLLVGLGDPASSEESLDAVIREVRSTVGFVKGQFRELGVTSVILGGAHGSDNRVKEKFNEEMGDFSLLSFPLWETWGLESPEDDSPAQGWEAALGLALRDVAP